MSNFSLAALLLIFSGSCFADPFNALLQSNTIRAVPLEQVSFKPYSFGYELGDGLGMTQHRREFADGTGAVRGSYGYVDALGVNRVVEYQTGKDGYKAVIRTNEPGVAGPGSADAVFAVQPPPPAAVAQGLRRLVPVVPVVNA